jgi:phosphoserine phosphatase
MRPTPEQLAVDQLIERLDLALAKLGARALIASDCDGTLWRGDVGEGMFELALERRALRVDALAALQHEAKRHGVAAPAAADDVHQVGAALYRAYQDGSYGELPAIEMMAWAFAGWSPDELAAFCADVLDGMGHAAELRPELRAVLDWAQQRQVPLWLVSASPHAVVAEAGRRLGIPVERVLALTPAVREGVLLAELSGTPTHGEGKLSRLRQAVGDAPLLAAFGDTGYDAAMLAEASVQVGVDPAPSLLARAVALGELVVIAGDDRS